ncbi:DsbA family protein [Hyphomonas sp.]
MASTLNQHQPKSTRLLQQVCIGLLLMLGLLAPSVAVAQSLTETEIKTLVLETIRENPEIIAEAFSILQQREEEATSAQGLVALEEAREAIERDPNAPVLGNPQGDVTVVEFFDYNCPYCKRAADAIKQLVETDKNVRLVYREWPILSPGSVFAARAALAAREQGRYEDLHWALMAIPRADEGTVIQTASDLGIDIEKLKADMDAPEVDDHIRLSMELTEALGFNGTPSFVIGDALVPGLVSLEQLRELVETARESR